ncbi:MAG: acyl-CoA dehydrogenase family protein [Proteobacteria bacterium]|nr:acyl-CoA dehydrogenase family protein [Pseudomonadota bacterium]MBU1745245.1 acyl-CoA dehydrogenase family protein [Pseudomonadota bacterium]MBU1965337.1 acyl-CoA dehydrogenase family protein [Pseudomonadota bacterium]
MDYELSEGHRRLQAEMGKFCREEIAPGAALFDETPREEAAARMKSNLKKLSGVGFLNLLLGGDLLGSCVAGEELARVCPSTYLAAVSSATAFGRAVNRFGTGSQRERYLPLLAAGDRIGAFGCTEREAGSDLAGMQTAAERKDGHWILNGEKDIVTNAPLADFFLILAWTKREAGPERGMSLFLIDSEATGVTIGRPLETMGLRGAAAAGIRLENCRVTDETLLGGAAGEGWERVQALLEEIKLALSMLCVGIGTACMEESTRHAKAKKAFGKPIGLFEGVGAKLATMFTLNDIGRMMTCRAAWAMEQKEPEGPVLASCAKLFTSEAAGRIADLAMQVHGGQGYLKGAVVERLYRDARFAALAYGTSEMQRAFIAKESLDRFRAA